MRKVGEGDKSEVFVLPDARILKLFFPHYAFLAEEEARLADALERAGVHAPRVDELREVDGRPAIVFGNLKEGKTLSDVVRGEPWRIASAARSLAELHAAVHAHSSPELPSQRERLRSDIRASDAISEAARRIALGVLDGLPDGDAVCHNDVHMLNVIAHPGGSMIIDWVLATRGSPLADVATAELQLRFGESPSSAPARWSLEAGRALFHRLYRRRYLGVAGCGPAEREELARWRLPAAAALSGRRAGAMREALVRVVDESTGGAAG